MNETAAFPLPKRKHTRTEFNELALKLFLSRALAVDADGDGRLKIIAQSLTYTVSHDDAIFYTKLQV